MSEKPICPERLGIAERVTKANQEVYRLTTEHNSKFGNPDRLAISGQLKAARREQGQANRQMRAHIEKHGCKG